MRRMALTRMYQRFGMPGVVGCLTHPAGAIWPYRFVTSMLSKLLAEHPNMTLETSTPVTGISNSTTADFRYTITTPRGNISTNHIVHCTNAYAAHLLPSLQGKIFPVRGQMTVQSPPLTFARLGSERSWSLMHTRGYDYMTQSPSSEGNIYLGGGLLQAVEAGSKEIGSTSDNECSEAALDHLKDQIAQRFDHGAGTTIKSAWSGIMGFTPDMLPVIGKVEDAVSGRSSGDNGREWIAAGFCGHGMVYCWSSGDVLARLITGKHETMKDWFPLQNFACTQERLARCSDEMVQAWLT
jgi:glycine/D-amino acid oxidase-like deaminating enzyme